MPAGSCLGGFRTPALCLSLDPRWPASENLRHCIGDRLAGEAFWQDLWRQVIEPCLEGGQYRQAVLLSQTEGVIGAGFAFARRLPCPSLDLVQGLEELERVQWRAIGFLSRLQRVGELASGMRHTAEMDSAVQRAPGIIAIAHQQAAVVAQKGLRMLLAT